MKAERVPYGYYALIEITEEETRNAGIVIVDTGMRLQASLTDVETVLFALGIKERPNELVQDN